MIDNEFITKTKALIESNGRPNMGRNRFEHSIRVLKMCEKLQAEVGGDLVVLQYSALLHDIGWSQTIPHAKASYNIAIDILDNLDLSDKQKKDILNCILIHSNKNNATTNLTLEQQILIDANLLDETGTLGIIFSSINSYRISMDINYTKILERLLYDVKRYEKILTEQLNLEISRKILEDRINFIENFCFCMKSEMFL